MHNIDKYVFNTKKGRKYHFFAYFCNIETNTLNYDKENFHQRSVVLYIPYG